MSAHLGVVEARDPEYPPLRELRELMLNALLVRRIPREDAEDAVQDALVTVLHSADRLADRLRDLPANRGYFATMALNALRMRLRSEQRRRVREEANGRSDVTTGEHTSPESAVVDDDELERLIQTASLTDHQRLYVRLVLREHLTIGAVAEHTGTTPRAVRAVLQRAVEIMRSQLHSEYG